MNQWYFAEGDKNVYLFRDDSIKYMGQIFQDGYFAKWMSLFL